MSARAALIAALFAATATTATAQEPLVVQLSAEGTIPMQVFQDNCVGFTHTAPRHICRAALVQDTIVRPAARPDAGDDVINLASAG